MRLPCRPLLVAALALVALPLAPARQDPEPLPGVQATLAGHTELIYSVAFSPDGNSLATASFDRSVKLWDAATGREIRTFAGPQGHQNLVLSVAFAPDGKTLASGGSDNAVRIWEVPQESPLRVFDLAGPATAVAAHADNQRLAVFGADGRGRLFHVADKKVIAELTDHTGPVTAAAFGATTPILASGGDDATLRFWNAQTGQPVMAFVAHGGPVTAVALHPNGQTAYSAGADGLVKSWPMPPVPPKKLPTHGKDVTCLAISPDGNILATGGADPAIHLTQFSDGAGLRTLTGPAAPVQCVALSNNAALVAAGTADGRLWLWKGEQGKPLGQFAAHPGGVTGIALAPGGHQLLTAGPDGGVKLWTLSPFASGPLSWSAHPPGAVRVAYLPNGRALTAGADGSVKLWDRGTSKESRKLGPLPGPATALAVSRDGALIAAASGQTVKLWKSDSGEPAGEITHPAAVSALVFSPDKARLLTGSADGRARIWDLATGRLLLGYPHGGAVRGVAWHPGTPTIVAVAADHSGTLQPVPAVRVLAASPRPIRTLALSPDGNQLLVGGEESAVKVINTGSGAEERVYTGAGGPVTAVAVAKNGQLVAVASADRKVRLFSPSEPQSIAEFATAAEVRGLAFHPNNTGLATGDASGAVTLWNTQYQPGQPPPPEFARSVQSFAHGAPVADIAFAPDGKTLNSAGQDRAVKAWRITADSPVANLSHPNYVDAVAYSPDGKFLATACHDGQLRLWDTAKNQPVRTVMASTPAQPNRPVEPLYCVAWSPDGKLLATGGNDRAVRVWNAADGKPVKEFKGHDEKASPKGHREGVFCLLFTPDGKHVVSGSSDRSIKLWDIDSGNLVREFVNPAVKAEYPVAHPGWVHGLRLLDGGKVLVSVGAAPRLHGYLAVWNVADGKLLSTREAPAGVFYAVDVNGDRLALGCGPRDRRAPRCEALIVKLPR